MKEKIKKLISFCVFITMLFIAIILCSNFFEDKKAKNKYEAFFESDTNFDVIFMGTSMMYNSVLPQDLWKEYGISSYNWGYQNCTIPVDYYLLKEITKYTSPKLVVIDMWGLIEYEIFENKKYRTDKIEQYHVQFDEIPISANKIKATLDIFDNYAGKEDFLWNFIKYHNRWNDINSSDFKKDFLSVQKGASLLISVGPSNYNPIDPEETVSLDSVGFDYLLKIFDYCEKEEIELLLVYNPIPADVEQQKVANSLEIVMKNYPQHKYLNLLNKGITDFSTDTGSDKLHLNYLGAKKTTSYLGKYIIENYDLDDYSKSKSWISEYEEYKKYKLEILNMQTDLTNTLVLLSDSDYNLIIEILDKNILNDETILNLINSIGANKSKIKYNTNMIVIKENGKKFDIIQKFNIKETSLGLLKKEYNENNYSIYLNDTKLYDASNEINENISIRITVLESKTSEILTIKTH